jgi:hypothetical protein
MRVRWLLDYVAAWQTLVFKGHVGDFVAIYKARRALKKWRHEFDADRERIHSTAVTPHIPERRNFSIVWQYYVKKHKTFADLPK